MISKNRVGYFVWTTHSHEGSIFLKVVKNILLKSEGSCRTEYSSLRCHVSFQSEQ